MGFLSNSALRPRCLGFLVMIGIAGHLAAAQANADLFDIVARIDYGYYAGDANLISAASAELERQRGNDAERAYYAGYAALRLSQLDTRAAPRLRRERADRCLAAAADLADEPTWAVEAHVLAAACLLAVERDDGPSSLGLQAKLARSIRAAREIDPRNPRLLLVAALALRTNDDAAQTRSRLAGLEAALEGFDAQTLEVELRPSWGRAEALANLGALHLALGNAREARDLIERALLEAPGYHFALQLQKRLSLH